MNDTIDGKIDAFLDSFPVEERATLMEYIALPNRPDIQPEIMALVFKFGNALNLVIDRVEQLRQEIGLTYDELRAKLLDKITN